MRAGRGPRSVADPESVEAAYAETLRRLARQPQSRASLRQRLVRSGYAKSTVDDALDRVATLGYLNDAAYAQALVRRRAGSRGQALIAQELRAKGIHAADADAALEQVDGAVEGARARALARGALQRKRPHDRNQLWAAIGPMLSRRGFPSGLIHGICAELATEWEASGRFDSAREPD